MKDMVLVKRATIGQIVKGDVTGLGEWVVGRIVGFDDKYIEFRPANMANDSADVRMIRAEVFKATEAEFTEEEKRVIKKPVIGEFEHCPSCGIHLSNGYQTDDNMRAIGYPGLAMHEYVCLACNCEFGPLIKRSKAAYNCRAASGRLSKDNSDSVALLLRGKKLYDVYEIAADFLGVTLESLVARYQHLNPGQQRMCLGTLLRRKN